MSLKNVIPGLSWLQNYDRTHLKGDLAAGLTVGVMLIPQGMAYAMLAGLPPIYGLYASTIPLIIYALFGTSRQLAVGPVAMVSLLTAAGVSAFAEGGTEMYIRVAILLALMVGLIQFLLGVFRLGFLVNFLSHPVISGFTSAAALIIGLSQLKHLMGVSIPRTHHVYEILIYAVEKLGETNLATLLVGLGGIALILLFKKYFSKIPGQLMAVIFGLVVVWILRLDQQGVKIVGDIPSGLPGLGIPLLEVDLIRQLIPTALAISLVSFMESIAVAKAIQVKHGNYKVIPNQELRALGLSNIVGSFFQSYPTTGGFSRTAVNDQAGAQTGLASVFSAVLIVLTLLFLTPLFYYLPQAILASVIMVAVFGLIDFKEARHLWHTDRRDFWMLLVTFIGTLALGIEQGIGLGVVLSLIMVVYQTTIPHFAELGRVPGTTFFRNLSRFESLEEFPEILIVRFDARLYFANITFFVETIERLSEEKGDALKVILVDCESINSLDSSAIHALERMIRKFREEGVEMYFSSVKGPLRDSLQKSGTLDLIGEHVFMSNQAAVEYYKACVEEPKPGRPYRHYTHQTN